MQQHNLVQGSEKWNQHRGQYFNASDSPAMLGLSKYKSRTQLLTERKTGVHDEVNESLQSRFDDGHRYERLARPVAAEIVGKSLYPVTGTEGKFGASFDGLTVNEDIAFEHKTLNNDIRACETIDDLDEMYLVQMEHQLMVAGAEKCLFLATKWDANDNLLEQKHFWYFPNAERRQKIIDGWAQFEIDLSTFEPVELIDMPKAAVTLELPALFIQAHGAILASNIEKYGEALAKRLADVRAIKLVTDQDFSNAKSAASLLRDNIKQANLAKDAMLEQTATVGEAARMIDAWCEDMRLTALQLEKDVEREDKAKKLAMINQAKGDFTEVINALENKVRPIRLNIQMPNFDLAIKGKSKYSSMKDAIDTLAANSTAEANRLALEIQDKQEYLKVIGEDYEFLFSDLQQIIFKADDDFKLLVNTRIKGHREAEEAKAEQIKKAAQAELIQKQEQERLANVVIEEKQPEPTLSNLEMVATAIVQTPNVTDMKKETVIRTQYFKGAVPTANELVCILASAMNVDEQMAHKWLIDTDFTKYKIAA